MKHSVQLHNLAPILVGKKIKHVSLTPLIWEGDVGLRNCRVHFADGAVVELQSSDLDQTLEYLSESIEHDDAYEVDAKSSDMVAGLVVEGVVVAQTIFSFGLLVSERRVICLDFTNGQSGVYLALCIRLVSDLMDETL